MSTKFNIITKTTYKEFCDKTNDIQIVENNLEMRRVTLVDKFSNKCQLNYNEEDTIIALTRFGENDPVHFLYLLVTLTDAVFLSENAFKNCIQIPLMNMLDSRMVEITRSTYEEFTKYFKENINYTRDFEKEFQLFTKGKHADSKAPNDELNSPERENNNDLISNAIGKDHKKLDDYFELDEDSELERKDIGDLDAGAKRISFEN